MFSQSRTVTYLEMDCLPTVQELFIFSNLNTLVCHNVLIPEQDCVGLFLMGRLLEHLTELRLNLARFHHAFDCPAAKAYAVFRDYYDLRLKDHMNHTRNHDLRIFLNGLLLNPQINHFDQYELNQPLFDCLRLMHMANLRACETVFMVEYQCLNDWLTDASTPADQWSRQAFFHQLFPNIRQVTVCAVTKPQLFLQFLTFCRALTSLEFNHAGLQNEDYEHLVQIDSVQHLHRLVLMEKGGGAAFQFGFLHWLTRLQYLESNMFSFELMIDRVQSLEIGGQLRLHFGSTLFAFKRDNLEQWTVKMDDPIRLIPKEQQCKTVSFPALLDHLGSPIIGFLTQRPA